MNTRRRRIAAHLLIASLALRTVPAAAQVPAPTATPTATRQDPAPAPPPSVTSPTPPPEAPRPAPETARPSAPLGEAGESCRARSDCRAELRCVSNVCTDEREGAACSRTADCGETLRCIDDRCTSPHAGRAPERYRDRDRDRDREEDDHVGLKGARPYFGIATMGGFTGFLGLQTGEFELAGSFMFAVRGGVMASKTELGFEVSPVTFLPIVDGGDPVLQATAGVGQLLQISDRVYWPIRFGAGVVAVNTNDEVLFQSRVDLIGLAYHAHPVLIEVHAPSVRHATEFDVIAAWSWLFGVSISVLGGGGR